MKPESPNANKLEAFIFDSFPLASRSVILEVPREEEFSPVKNAPGSASDTPQTAREMILKCHAHWLSQAGVSLSEPYAEISPSVSLFGEKLKRFSDTPVQSSLEKPAYFDK